MSSATLVNRLQKMLLLAIPLLLCACSSNEHRQHNMLNTANDFGVAPTEGLYQVAIEQHLKDNIEIVLPALFKPQYSKPQQLFEFNSEGEIIFSGWSVEVLIPLQSLTNLHVRGDASDYKALLVKFKGDNIISSSFTKIDLLSNDGVSSQITKYVAGHIMDTTDNSDHATVYGATYSNHGQSFTHVRNIDYDHHVRITPPDVPSSDRQAQEYDYEVLLDLNRLFEAGVLTDVEFSAAKRKVLGI